MRRSTPLRVSGSGCAERALHNGERRRGRAIGAVSEAVDWQQDERMGARTRLIGFGLGVVLYSTDFVPDPKPPAPAPAPDPPPPGQLSSPPQSRTACCATRTYSM